jgi:protein O-GlcNAc transferase
MEQAVSDPDALMAEAERVLAAGPNAAMLGRLAEAWRAHPTHAGVTRLLADALRLAGQRDQAVAAYAAALALDAMSFEAWFGMATAQVARGAFAVARDALVQALGLRPQAEEARCLLAEALFHLGEADAASAAYQRVIARGEPALRDAALASLAVMIPGSAVASHEMVRAVREAWIGRVGGAIRAMPMRAAPSGRRIRVGYLSAFFGECHWMRATYGVINRHDRTRFEVYLIADGAEPSAEAGYVAQADDRVLQAKGMANGALARAIAQAELDVLVDLNGYSLAGRLGLFPYRPARLQLGWLGHSATSAVPGIDALVGDAVVVRPEEEEHFSERVLRVPGTCLAFEVSYPMPDVAPLPWLANGVPTLGCMGSGHKLTPRTLEAWAAILRAVPAARLVVGHAGLEEEGDRDELLRRLEGRGVAADRVTLSGRAEHFEFLRGYGAIDIALDTLPTSGTATTAEALWQGVPVLAVEGDRWASRTSASLLRAAGLSEWVAEDIDGFVGKAVALLGDAATPARLVSLRAGMRERLMASAACDSAGLCRALEALYTQGLDEHL